VLLDQALGVAQQARQSIAADALVQAVECAQQRLALRIDRGRFAARTRPGGVAQGLNALGWACYRFDDGSVRFVCSWATREEAVDELLQAIATL